MMITQQYRDIGDRRMKKGNEFEKYGEILIKPKEDKDI